MDVKAPLRRFDDYQQTKPALALPLGILKKFGDDEGGSMVSLIAYRAFFSLFPLLLLMITILGYVLAGNDQLREEVVNGTLSQFPIVGNQLKGGELNGSGVALAVGIVGSVLAGIGVVMETEHTFDRCWGVPKTGGRGFVGSRVRAIALLVALGGLAVVSTVVGGLAAGGADILGAGGKVAGIAVATVLNLFVFGAVFRLLTTDTVDTRALIPGVVVATIGWEVLQLIGGWYISHEVKNASAVYGTFALVIGLLAWIHLGATFVVLGAETNVVRTRKLWPRSMLATPGSGT
ncbi:MAG TPA: YihY/virulence factor BrkB family protein [Solirubrobacterales bacterium]|jgi:YihY family inner membrane protein|nr:YihY/virulence factor BrkB family protein [Solirubrobacterales bacterium]